MRSYKPKQYGKKTKGDPNRWRPYRTGPFNWRAARAAYLKDHPLCVRCGAQAEHLDHITPHEGDEELFQDPLNWQSLCAKCHSVKTRIENKPQSYSDVIPGERIVVTGTTGSGKTTYVNQRRKPGDIVWDWDAVKETLTLEDKWVRPGDIMTLLLAMMETAIDWLGTHQTPRRVWWISANKQTAKRLAKAWKAQIVDCDVRLKAGAHPGGGGLRP